MAGSFQVFKVQAGGRHTSKHVYTKFLWRLWKKWKIVEGSQSEYSSRDDI